MDAPARPARAGYSGIVSVAFFPAGLAMGPDAALLGVILARAERRGRAPGP